MAMRYYDIVVFKKAAMAKVSTKPELEDPPISLSSGIRKNFT